MGMVFGKLVYIYIYFCFDNECDIVVYSGGKRKLNVIFKNEII